MNYTTIWNCACWHLEKSEHLRDEKERARHAEIAERLFLLAHRLR